MSQASTSLIQSHQQHCQQQWALNGSFLRRSRTSNLAVPARSFCSSHFTVWSTIQWTGSVHHWEFLYETESALESFTVGAQSVQIEAFHTPNPACVLLMVAKSACKQWRGKSLQTHASFDIECVNPRVPCKCGGVFRLRRPQVSDAPSFCCFVSQRRCEQLVLLEHGLVVCKWFPHPKVRRFLKTVDGKNHSQPFSIFPNPTPLSGDLLIAEVSR